MNGVGPVVSFKGLMTTFLNPQDPKKLKKEKESADRTTAPCDEAFILKRKTWQEMKVVGEEKQKENN